MADLNSSATPAVWLERSKQISLRPRKVSDFADVHHAAIRCWTCDCVMQAFYKPHIDPTGMECAECGSTDTEIVTYIKYVYKQ